MSTIPFGKFKGSDVEDVSDSYLRWLTDQDWFNDQYEELSNEVVDELNWRETWNKHVNT